MGGRNRNDVQRINDSVWYKDAIYELHVRAFYDSGANGVGNFRGLTQKLDYLHDLGVTALWPMPFCPSPLKDDGYDMADYTDIHPLYEGDKENIDAIEFMRRFNTEVYHHYPDVQTTAEESTSWAMVSRPTYVGGLGFA